MANYVKNILKMKGIKNLPLFSKDEAGGLIFDFNKLIPMPESLNITSGSIERIAVETAIREKLYDPNAKKEDPKFVPAMTDEEYQQYLSYPYVKDKTKDELIELGLKYIRNVAQYGAPTWYEWCNEHWNTKWNSWDLEIIDDNTINFITAWDPPIPVINKLVEKYPDINIDYWWADENMGYNTGYAKGENGILEIIPLGDGSSLAYENYVKCWGESRCLATDENGVYYHKDCETCHGCD